MLSISHQYLAAAMDAYGKLAVVDLDVADAGVAASDDDSHAPSSGSAIANAIAMSLSSKLIATPTPRITQP